MREKIPNLQKNLEVAGTTPAPPTDERPERLFRDSARAVRNSINYKMFKHPF